MEAAPSLPSVQQMKTVLVKAQELLENDFTETDLERGWYHFLREQRVGILGTAAGIVALCQIDDSSPYIHKATTQLIETQIASSDPVFDGGWGIASIKHTPICESTCWCAYALHLAGISVMHSALQRALAWIISNQNDDEGWGGAKGYPSRTYPTALAIRTLSRLSPSSQAVQPAIQWLENSQCSDGGWAELPRGQSTPIHTAHAILALLDAGVSPTSKVIRHGIQWLYDHRNSWTGAFFDSYELSLLEESKPRMRIDHTVLPWVVTALVKSGENINKLEIKLAISKLVSSQHVDGYWKSETSERISVFETQDAVIALRTILDQSPSLELTLQMQDRLALLEEEFRKFLPGLMLALGISNSLSRIRRTWKKHYWILTIICLSLCYALVERFFIHFADWRDQLLYGSASVVVGAIVLAPTLKAAEKIAYALAITLASASIILFNYSPGETIATVLFAVALSAAFVVFERYRK